MWPAVLYCLLFHFPAKYFGVFWATSTSKLTPLFFSLPGPVWFSFISFLTFSRLYVVGLTTFLVAWWYSFVFSFLVSDAQNEVLIRLIKEAGVGSS